MRKFSYWLNALALTGLLLATSCQKDESEIFDKAITSEKTSNGVTSDDFFVSAQEAHEIAVLVSASGFMDIPDIKTARTSGTARKSKAPKKIRSSKVFKDNKKRLAFYVHNYEGGKGFAIISGDKRISPILAYNDSGSIDLENYSENPGLAHWIASLQEDITALRDDTNKANSEQAVAVGWEPDVTINSEPPCDPCDGGGTVYVSYGPLIRTLWGQGCGFNDFTPSKSNGDCGHAPAGCGPVAVAQVLWHHRSRLGQVTYNGVPINFNNMPRSIQSQYGAAPRT